MSDFYTYGHEPWTLWDAARRRWGVAVPPQASYANWSDCVQQLLGPSAGDPGTRRALYTGGATPLEAARRIVLGDDGVAGEL